MAGLPQATPTIGEAQILLRLAPGFAVPDMPPARHILAARPDIHADAHEAARAGRIAAESADGMGDAGAGPDRGDGAAGAGGAGRGAARCGWRRRAVLALSPAMPGLADALTGVEIRLRPQRARLADLLAPPPSRLLTPVKGLLAGGRGRRAAAGDLRPRRAAGGATLFSDAMTPH